MITKTFMLEVTTPHEIDFDELRELVRSVLFTAGPDFKRAGILQVRIPFTSDQDVQSAIDAKLTTILRRIDDLPARILNPGGRVDASTKIKALSSTSHPIDDSA
jgi:hypothetical protein